MKTSNLDDYFPDDKPKLEPKKRGRPSKVEKVVDEFSAPPLVPRYVVGLRSEKESCCYKDLFETEKLSEAKEKVKEILAKYKRGVIIYDRVDFNMEKFEPTA